VNLANDRNVAGQAHVMIPESGVFLVVTQTLQFLKCYFITEILVDGIFFQGWVVPTNFNKFGIFSTFTGPDSYLSCIHVHVSHLMDALFVGASLVPPTFFCGMGWDRKRTAQLVPFSLAKSPRGVLRAVTCHKRGAGARKEGVIFLGWSLVRHLKKKKKHPRG